METIATSLHQHLLAWPPMKRSATTTEWTTQKKETTEAEVLPTPCNYKLPQTTKNQGEVVMNTLKVSLDQWQSPKSIKGPIKAL